MKLDYFNDKEREAQKKFAQVRDALLSPFLFILTKFGISANLLTIIGVVILIIGIFYSTIYHFLYLPSIILYVLFDGIDGPLARYQNKASNMGALNDVTADQIGVPVVMAYLAYSRFIDNWVAALSSGIYNMVICNLFKKKIAFTFRLKYVYFAIGAICSLKLVILSKYANLFMIGCCIYYLVMIGINQRLASQSSDKTESDS